MRSLTAGLLLGTVFLSCSGFGNMALPFPSLPIVYAISADGATINVTAANAGVSSDTSSGASANTTIEDALNAATPSVATDVTDTDALDDGETATGAAKEAMDLREKIVETNRSIENTARKIEDLNAAVTDAEQTLESLEAKIEELETQQEKTKSSLSVFIKNLYERQSAFSLSAMLFESRTITEFLNRGIYGNAVIEAFYARLASLDEQAENIQEIKDEAERLRAKSKASYEGMLAQQKTLMEETKNLGAMLSDAEDRAALEEVKAAMEAEEQEALLNSLSIYGNTSADGYTDLSGILSSGMDLSGGALSEEELRQFYNDNLDALQNGTLSEDDLNTLRSLINSGSLSGITGITGTTGITDGSGASFYYVQPYAYSDDDLLLLASLIQAEAGGYNYAGMVAVGSVVMNRLYDSRFPNTVPGVIYAPGQFYPEGSGRLAVIMAEGPWDSCIQAARDVFGGIRNTDKFFYKSDWYAEEHGITGVNIGGNVFHD